MVVIKLILFGLFPGQLMACFRRATGFDYRPLLMMCFRNTPELKVYIEKYVQANELMLDKACKLMQKSDVEMPKLPPPSSTTSSSTTSPTSVESKKTWPWFK
jgi:hypothetical protein